MKVIKYDRLTLGVLMWVMSQVEA